MKLAIQSWEKNGYDDSDGYMIFMDTEKMEVKEELFWTTRGAMPYSTDGYCTDLMEWTPQRIAFVRSWLVEKKIKSYRHAEMRHREFPKSVEKGETVKLVEAHSNRIKTEKTEVCWKCEGSGEWVNPYKKSDIRECMSCKGTGKKSVYRYKKGNGSKKWEVGTEFKVLSSVDHGRFNTVKITVKGFTNDGEFIQAPLAKLNVVIDSPSDVVLRTKIESNTVGYMNLVSELGGTWVDNDGDYINQALKEIMAA